MVFWGGKKRDVQALLYHPSFLRGVKSKVDELGRFFQGYLGVPLGPQKG